MENYTSEESVHIKVIPFKDFKLLSRDHFILENKSKDLFINFKVPLNSFVESGNLLEYTVKGSIYIHKSKFKSETDGVSSQHNSDHNIERIKVLTANALQNLSTIGFVRTTSGAVCK